MEKHNLEKYNFKNTFKKNTILRNTIGKLYLGKIQNEQAMHGEKVLAAVCSDNSAKAISLIFYFHCHFIFIFSSFWIDDSEMQVGK